MNTSIKRVIASSLALSATAATFAMGVAAASAAEPEKVTYCHATGSLKNPYVMITTSKEAVLKAHSLHQDDRDVIPPFDYTVNGAMQSFLGQTPFGTDPYLFVLSDCGADEL